MNRNYGNRSYQEDRSTCTFYTKIGACRHGEKCSRKHIKPASSRTVILSNLYENPRLNKNEEEVNPKQLQEYFDQFYKDIYIRLTQLGEVASVVVCENENHHLNGNVYVKFTTTEAADLATETLNQEWFNGRPVHCDLSPVDNFVEANCRAYDVDQCTRGDHCNFMHVRHPTKSVHQALSRSQQKSNLLKKLAAVRTQVAPSAETNSEKATETAAEPHAAATNDTTNDTKLNPNSDTSTHTEPHTNTTSMIQQLFA